MAGDQDTAVEVRAGMQCHGVQVEDSQSTDSEAGELH